MAQVGIVMGSDSDLPVMQNACTVLAELGVAYDVRISSAHRAPGKTAALAAGGSPEAMAGVAALSLGIGLQNLPEGAAISLPVRQAGASRARSFCAGAASGLVEPLGGVLAAALAVWVAGWMPWLLSMAAGAMITVTAQEMIPDAAAEGRAGIVSVVLGFALMMALDVALG